MKFVGKWVLDSVATLDENFEKVYLSAQEFINSPMPYVDESDEEAVADELKERRMLVSTQLSIKEDGLMYMLMPLPEGVSDEEIQEAAAAGEITLIDGCMTQAPLKCEERDGELWIDTGIEGEVFGEEADTWACASEGDFINFMNFRFKRAD